MDNIFYAFQGFHNLVDLYIGIDGYHKNAKINGSVACLKSLKGLKSLDILFECNTIDCIREEFFDGNDRHLPNLSVLRIKCVTEFTDKTILQLSHLKKLKTFQLNNQKINRFITDESVCAVINGCPALETLFFLFET